MESGEVLGIGSDYYALPWNALKYNTQVGGYQIDMSRDKLQGAPAASRSEVISKLEDQTFGTGVRLLRHQALLAIRDMQGAAAVAPRFFQRERQQAHVHISGTEPGPPAGTPKRRCIRGRLCPLPLFGRLSGKVALITGGDSGIGRACSGAIRPRRRSDCRGLQGRDRGCRGNAPAR